jgi:hypothetical protein
VIGEELLNCFRIELCNQFILDGFPVLAGKLVLAAKLNGLLEHINNDIVKD